MAHDPDGGKYHNREGLLRNDDDLAMPRAALKSYSREVAR